MHMVRIHIVHCAFASCAGYICTMHMLHKHNVNGANAQCNWCMCMVDSPGFWFSWLAWLRVFLARLDFGFHCRRKCNSCVSSFSSFGKCPFRSSKSALPSLPISTHQPQPHPSTPPHFAPHPNPSPHTPQLQYTGSIPTTKKDVTSKCTTAALCSSFAITTLAGSQTSPATSHAV